MATTRITFKSENDNFRDITRISLSKWDSGIIYSCARNCLGTLYQNKNIAMDKSGIYLLFSKDDIYVGQATNLKNRLSSHDCEKEGWWNYVIVFSNTSSLWTKDKLDYLESNLITLAKSNSKYNCRNVTAGNNPLIDEDDAEDLDSVLAHIDTLLRFLGIDEQYSKKDDDIPSTNNEFGGTPLYKGIIDNKTTAILHLNALGITIPKPYSYARLGDKGAFWMNPSISIMSNDWTIILNNQQSRELMIIQVPANTFPYSPDAPMQKGILRMRKDPKHSDQADVNILPDSLKDKRSGCDFSKFLKKKVKY